MGFMTFIASTISRVSPACTCWPTAAKGLEPGSADRYTVPTMGERTASASGDGEGAPTSPSPAGVTAATFDGWSGAGA